MSLFIEWPLLALAPALVFLALGVHRQQRLALACGSVWLLYSLYELGMQLRILCSGECNIRIDLLLLHPLLLLATLVGVVDAVRGGGETRASR